MRVTYDGIHGFIEYEPSEAVAFKALREAFSVLDENRFMVESFRKKYWDGRHNMITAKGKFLRGLTDDIRAWLTKQGFTLEGEHFNTQATAKLASLLPAVRQNKMVGINLWDHQYRMVEKLLESGSGCVEGVTGSGKTESISLLLKLLIDKVDRVFVLVHLIGLMDQSYQRFCLRCPQHKSIAGMLGDGKRPKSTDRIIFSTQQSLASMLGLSKRGAPNEEIAEMWAKTGAVIVDECHNVTRDDYQDLMSTLPSTETMVFQFSGTPETNDQMRDWIIVGTSGRIVCRVQRKELEDKGIIAKAVALMRQF